MIYAIDKGNQNARRNQAQAAKGKKPSLRQRRDSWSLMEVASIVGCGRMVMLRYRELGVIPPATYPSKQTRYWRHQAVLLTKLFNEMRKQGYPRRTPQFVGSPYWTRFLNDLRSEWKREPDALVQWKARGGNDHENSHD